MKYLIVLLFLVVGCSEKPKAETPTWEQREQASNEFAKTLEVGDCIQYERFRKAEFSFEKDYHYKSEIITIMAKDPKALLIARPSSHCELKEQHKCKYWFHPEEFGDINLLTIPGDSKKLKCPKELSRESLAKRLINSKEYKIDAR